MILAIVLVSSLLILLIMAFCWVFMPSQKLLAQYKGVIINGNTRTGKSVY